MAKNKKDKVKAVDSAEKAPKKKKAKALEAAAAITVPAKVEKPKRPAAKKAPVEKSVTISNSDIALRAYYIAEDRARHGHHGDESSDWAEAERQLRQEARKK